MPSMSRLARTEISSNTGSCGMRVIPLRSISSDIPEMSVPSTAFRVQSMCSKNTRIRFTQNSPLLEVDLPEQRRQQRAFAAPFMPKVSNIKSKSIGTCLYARQRRRVLLRGFGTIGRATQAEVRADTAPWRCQRECRPAQAKEPCPLFLHWDGPSQELETQHPPPGPSQQTP